VVVAINKMDLVGYSQDVYNNIVIDYSALAKQLGLEDVTFIPMSALHGDNIVDKSESMPWFEGQPLLTHLEEVNLHNDINLSLTRFQVQYVIRPQQDDLHDYRGYAGKVQSGIYRTGDAVTILPSGKTTTIQKLEVGGEEVEEAFAPQSVVIHLNDDLDVSRGDTIVKNDQLPQCTNEQEVYLCWLDEKPLIQGNKYSLQQNSRVVRAMVRDIEYKLDVNTLEKHAVDKPVVLNEVVKATLKTAVPIAFDSYSELPVNGCAILVDETSNSTVAAVLFQ
jgi:sulfate adenylyltransferase subunit 1